MNYDYEIQSLENKIRNNNEKIERLENIRKQVRHKQENLQMLDTNRAKITSMFWKKRTTNIAKQITLIQHNFQKENFEHESNIQIMLKDTINHLKSQSSDYRNDMKYYKRKQEKLEG